MITERLRCVAESNSGRLAIIDGNERIAYGELLQRIDAARFWIERALHVQPGDVVFATVTTSWQFVACLFAVAELGGIFLPCRPGSRAPELKVLAEKAGIQGVITDPESRSEWNGVVSMDRVVGVPDRFEKAGSHAISRQPAMEAAAVYIGTSGSTGVPRIVPRTHGNLIAGASSVARALGIHKEHRWLCAVPLHYAYSLHNNLIAPLLKGACTILVRHFTPAACAEAAAREGADVLFGSPFIYRALLPYSHPLGRLKWCISSGARLTDSLSAEWERGAGVRLRQWYGATETHGIALDRSQEPPPPGILGTPIHDVEVRMLDDGELAVRSPMVMPGYIGAPELNAQAFVEGYYRTGDLGSVDSEGRLKLLGRIRRLINIGGVKVDPVEVERAIELLDGVVACHVDSAGGEPDNEVIRAQIQVRTGAVITRTQVIAHCRLRLSEHKLPRVVEFVSALPVTITGKMIRPATDSAKPSPVR